MPKTLLLLLLALAILPFGVTAQEQQGEDISKLLPAIEKSLPDTHRVRLLTEASQYYLYATPRDDSALYFATEAITLSKRLNDKTGLANNQLTTLALLLKKGMQKQARKEQAPELEEAAALQETLITEARSLDPHQEATMRKDILYQYNLAGIEDPEVLLPLYESALERFRQLKEKPREGWILLKLGDLYMQAGNYAAAEGSFRGWLALVPDFKDRDHMIAYSLLGINNTYLGNFPLGVRYGLQSIKISEEIKDTSGFQSQLYGYMGATYEASKEREESIKYYRKSLAIAERERDSDIIYIMAANVAKQMAQTDLMGSVMYMEEVLERYPLKAADEGNMRLYARMMIGHMGLKDYAGGQKYCDSLLAFLYRLPEQSPVRSAILSPVIQFFIVSGRYGQAKELLPMYEAQARKSGAMTFLREIQFRYYKIDSAQGNLASALDHFKQYKALNDSLYNKDKAKEIAELQIKYETEHKDNDLKLKEQAITLLTNQAQLQRAAAERKDQSLRLKEKDIELLVRDKELQQALSRKNEQHLQLQEQSLKLKEKDISLLTKESLLQRARLTESRSTRNFMLAGAVMLLLLLALSYSRYRAKQKANTEINKKNLELQHLLAEKEWLLKEIHHRVKNNLQTIVSLLESQSAFLKDDARQAILDSQNRVNAMSLIHQKLYQAEKVASINLAQYLPELVSHLKECFTTRNRINFQLYTDPIELDVSQAVPLGLILNEAITNAIKYAFPEPAADQCIAIRIEQDASLHIRLSISDNGIGLPPGFDLHAAGGLGLKLMSGLTEDLGGQFSITGGAGTCIGITFAANAPLAAVPEAVAA